MSITDNDGTLRRAAQGIFAHLGRSSSAWAICCLTICALSAGCSALHPLKGLPVNYFPQELRGEVRSGKQTIDLSLLRQTPPDHYLIDTGDVLGIYVEGVLGKREEVPPVHFPINSDIPPSLGYPIPVREDGTISLPLSKPIMVRGMTMRAVEETIRKAYTQDQAILKAGSDRILVSLQKPRSYNVLVIRQEVAANQASGAGGGAMGTLNLGNLKRGTGKLVSLPAYKNDVLHALAETGGLPGLDAENTIYVLRRKRNPNQSGIPENRPPLPGGWTKALPTQARHQRIENNNRRNSAITQIAAQDGDLPTPWGHTPPHPVQGPQQGFSPTAPRQFGPQPAGPTLAPMTPEQYPSYPQAGPEGMQRAPGGMPHPHEPLQPIPATDYAGPMDFLKSYGGRDAHIVKIPVRLHPGQMPQFSENEIILQDGDIVFIETRDTEIFYTGGLLGGGQYTLPRDYDLDVLGAISIASSRSQQGGGGSGGFGNRMGGVSAMNQDISVSASDVVVLRQLPDGGQIPIKLDLNKAMRDPKYRIRIQPGDYVILQYKPYEAVAAFFERNLLAGGLIGLAASNSSGGGK